MLNGMNRQIETPFDILDYRERKSRYQDYVLFYRTGNFYCVLFADSIKLCEVAGLFPTESILIPVGCENRYYSMLLENGISVVECDPSECGPFVPLAEPEEPKRPRRTAIFRRSRNFTI